MPSVPHERTIKMYLRPLTDAELVIIREAKKTANAAIKKQRDTLARKIKKDNLSISVLADLNREFKALQYITEQPVIISLDGEQMSLNYELLKKLNKSLEKRGWSRTVAIRKSTLVIEYPAGEIGINQLPDYQLELLGALPVVDLKYGFDFLN